MNREKELHLGARTADALVYIVGLAGVAGGGLLLRGDQAGYAVIVWALTFCAGAALRLLAAMARAMADVVSRTRETSEHLQRLEGDSAAAAPREDPSDRWGRLH